LNVVVDDVFGRSPRSGLDDRGGEAFALLDWMSSRQSRGLVLAGSIAALAVVTIVDRHASPALGLGLLDLLPVMAVAWAFGFRVGVCAAVVSGAAGFASSLGNDQTSLADGIWNLVIDLAVFLVVVWLVDKERSSARRQNRAASHDALTGVLNRRGFLDISSRVLHRAAADGLPVSLLYADLDNLKVANDEHGHTYGDAMLVAFGDAASSVLRPSDLLGRLGGDEFGIVLPGSSTRDARLVAQRLVDRLAQGTDRPPIRVSVGIASGDSAHAGIEELLQDADRAMYEAKRAGGGTIRGPLPRDGHDTV
jgi:diguanylate cyclase (GGDEF)-like protein